MGNDQSSQLWISKDEWTQEFLQTLKTEIKTYKNELVDHPKILFVGPIGSGKSSFISSISSVFVGRVSSLAPIGRGHETVTEKFTEHKVSFGEDGQNKTLNFCLCDTSGYHNNYKITTTEFKYFLDGNVPNHYKFQTNPKKYIDPTIDGFRDKPQLADRAHCVCFVFDSIAFEAYETSLIDQFKEFIQETRRKELVPIILMTKIDLVSEYVNKNVSNVYSSKKLKTKMEIVSEKLGVPKKDILPIRNYHDGHKTTQNYDILVLFVLRQLLRGCDDYLRRFFSNNGD